MISSLLAICAGASAGAVLRWLLGLALNPLFPTVPLGTLIQQGRLLWAGGAVALHVCGSLLMTFLGMGSFALIRYFWGVWR